MTSFNICAQGFDVQGLPLEIACGQWDRGVGKEVVATPWGPASSGLTARPRACRGAPLGM